MTHLLQQQELLKQPLPSSFDEMVAAMLRCEQSEGFTVYQHGQAVAENMRVLRHHLDRTYNLPERCWRLPRCFEKYGPRILANLHTEEISHLYGLYHDCGKFYCATTDPTTGQIRFPNHADVSRIVWESVGGDPVVGRLISWDMALHVATSQEIEQLLHEWTIEDSMTLIVAACSEIHANAMMFGGLDSVSFKMKFKHLERRSNQVCRFWFHGP